MGRKRHGPVDVLAAAFLTFCTVTAVFPPIRALGNSAVAVALALAGWLATAIAQRPGYFLRPSWYRLMAIGFAFYAVMVPYFWYNDVIGNRYLSLMLVTWGFVVYGYYEVRGQLAILRRVLQVTIGFASVTIVRTILGLISNPYLARSIKQSGDYSVGLSAQGVGGYEIVYFSVVACPMALYGALTARSLVKRVALGLVYIVLMLLVVLSNYMTALVLVVISTATMLVFHFGRRQGNGVRAVSISVLMTVAILLGSQVVSGAVQGVVLMSPGGPTAARLTSAGDSLLTGIYTEYVYDRAPAMQESLDAVLERPLTGLVTTEIAASGGYLVGFGQHSHVLDTVALFGFLVGGLGIAVLFVPFESRLRSGRHVALTVSVLLSYAGVLVFNNATPSLGVAACLLYPLVQSDMDGARLHQPVEDSGGV